MKEITGNEKKPSGASGLKPLPHQNSLAILDFIQMQQSHPSLIGGLAK
jgi:hypothetical protein